MEVASGPLVVAGLAIDIIGAGVIALPDIPRVRQALWSERVRKGLREMEGNGLRNDQPGFEDILQLLEEFYGVEFSDSAWALRVGMHTMSRYGFESVYVFTDVENQNEQIALGKDFGSDVDYRMVRRSIKERADRREAAVRVLGFVLLATGFLLQIVGNFV
ncbi:hypothetical protein [Halomarina oriensis]|uniref:Uncharacterized protein n=1 Tax=Halomarina oriensis TaxID=671145 RepID=A0A6B0GV25_9EURY|nr:hypothetical protein [Halomarina oriensis]MWG35578.1 hypothetical protein [Halomarina oriensis]